jgi:hypothetical protein
VRMFWLVIISRSFSWRISLPKLRVKVLRHWFPIFFSYLWILSAHSNLSFKKVQIL